MRFVSISPGFAVSVIGQRSHATPYGDTIIDREGYIAHFNQNDLTDADLDFAEATFGAKLPGMTVLIDEVTPTPYIDRISVFDTDEAAVREQWETRTFKDPLGNEIDFKEHVEAVLSARAVDHPEYRLVTALPVEPPWPNYLAFRGDMQALLDRLVDDGHDLRKVLRFEEQVGHRPAMIEALEKLIAEQEAEEHDAVAVSA